MISEESIESAYQDLSKAVVPAATAGAVLRRAVVARRRLRAAGVGGAVVAVIVACAVGVGAVANQPVTTERPPTQTRPTPSPSDPSLEAHLEWQQAVRKYQRDLDAAARRYDNYAGTAFRFRQRAILVFGTGQPPPAVAALLSDPPKEAVGRWVCVPYSKRQLSHAGRLLLEALPRVTLISYSADNYRSVVVSINRLPRSGPELQRLRRLAARTTDIPVTLRRGGYPQF